SDLTYQTDVRTRSPEHLAPLRAMTRLLDNAITVPGTRFRFGLDALIGLVPGIGDAIGAVFSSFIVYQAARLGASNATLARMVGNVALDTVVGQVPLLGDLFDAGWKANSRNLDLLEAHLERPASTARASRWVLFLVIVGLLLLLVGIIALGIVVVEFVVDQVR
ncbi:MAG TPA: DUF4112 domain-containing protein, partial [Gemmatimonadales bacterium]|nr:DUF4112 domain-containing protein [Gemmatimonadales bacterium]